jgi:hypothetical protein
MDYPALRKIQIRSRSLRDQLIESPFAWPGGYPLFAVASDGGAICKDCCKTESRSIGSTYGTDGWSLEALAVNWEDSELYCNHCSTRIKSAYAEEETA